MIVSSINKPALARNVTPGMAAESLLEVGAVTVSEDVRQTEVPAPFSALARRLSVAEMGSLAKDAGLDPQTLGRKASRLLDELANAPVDESQSDTKAFHGMPRDQLALITYDESGQFTLKERASAWRESYRQENLWRQTITHRIRAEHNDSEVFNDVLAHFQSLPFIEQAQYSADYAARLQHRIGHGAIAPNASASELIEMSLPEPAFVRTAKLNLPTAMMHSTHPGRGMMLSRLFDGFEPAVQNGKHGMRLDTMALGDYLFLTKDDRMLISDVYSYAQDQGVDLTYVDLIAADIGKYRRVDDGRLMANFNSGHSYNSEGWQLSIDFNEQDAAVASRLLHSAAIESTRFDQGFLRYILEPGFGAMSHHSNFTLLENFVTRFSAQADKAEAVEERFSTYTPPCTDKRYVLTVSREVRCARPEPSDEASGSPAIEFCARHERNDQRTGYSSIEVMKAKAGLSLLRHWCVDESNAPEVGWLRRLWERCLPK